MKPFPKYRYFVNHNTAWLLAATREEIEAWVKECDEIQEYNRAIRESIDTFRLEAITEIVGACAGCVPAVKKAVEKDATRCVDAIIKQLGLRDTWCISNPSHQIVFRDEAGLQDYRTKSLWERVEAIRAFRKAKEEREVQKRVEYVRAIQLAEKHGIDPTLPEDELVLKVSSAERAAAIAGAESIGE